MDKWSVCSNEELKEQLSRFSAWLNHQAKKFKLVVLIGGNHDRSLDREHPSFPGEQMREDFLRSLPENVAYLDNSECSYRGLCIWGSSIGHYNHYSPDKPSDCFRCQDAGER